MDYTQLASKETIAKTAEALRAINVEPILVENEQEALAKIQELIPKGSSVMNGASRTLEQIGFIEYLSSGDHGWTNLHAQTTAETDPVKRGELRKKAAFSDYYLGSVHALAQTGQFVIASNTGSQLPGIVFTAPNIIFVVGVQKIVPTLSDAFDRLEKHVIPLEEQNMQQKYHVGTFPSKVLIFQRENPVIGRKVRMILVNKTLGF